MIYYLKSLYLSLFSKSFYADLIIYRKNYGFIYILLVALIISVPSSLNLKKQIREVFDFEGGGASETELYLKKLTDKFPQIIYNKPQFTINDNNIQKISVNNKNYLMIIDPKNEITDFSKYSDAIILKPEKLVYNNKNKELMVFSAEKVFESFKPYFINSDSGMLLENGKFLKDVGYFLSFSYPILLFLTFVITSIKYLFWAFLFSNAAFFIFYLKIKPYTLPNKTLFRIAAFSLTPVALFELVRLVFSLENLFMYPVIASVIINLIYINLITDNFKIIQKQK